MPSDTVPRTVAELQAQITALSAELAETNAQLRAEMAARDAAEEQLRVARRRRDEFLATLAHELRNPLAPVRYCLKMLDAPETEAHKRRWSSQVLTRQVDRMALLLNDLLDVSRLTEGRLDLKISPVELGSVIEAAVETATPLIESKQLNLTMALPPESITVAVDALRVSQALVNLLTNAAKFTAPGGRITLRVQVEPDELAIEVLDTGIGLDPAAIPELFDMFTRVTPAGHSGEGGLGIGLALAKGLVALHGGTVEAASGGLNRGAEFTIRFPVSIIIKSVAGPQPIPATIAAPEPVHCKVLIIDDNHDSADALALLLKCDGFQVTVGYSGQQALELGSEHLPDALVMDIGLPDMIGYEVARRIRQQVWGKALLLVAMTGWGQASDRERARRAGFDRHLTKPVDPGELVQLLLNSMPARSRASTPATQRNSQIDPVPPPHPTPELF